MDDVRQRIQAKIEASRVNGLFDQQVNHALSKLENTVSSHPLHLNTVVQETSAVVRAQQSDLRVKISSIKDGIDRYVKQQRLTPGRVADGPEYLRTPKNPYNPAKRRKSAMLDETDVERTAAVGIVPRRPPMSKRR